MAKHFRFTLALSQEILYLVHNFVKKVMVVILHRKHECWSPTSSNLLNERSDSLCWQTPVTDQQRAAEGQVCFKTGVHSVEAWREHHFCNDLNLLPEAPHFRPRQPWCWRNTHLWLENQQSQDQLLDLPWQEHGDMMGMFAGMKISGDSAMDTEVDIFCKTYHKHTWSWR